MMILIGVSVFVSISTHCYTLFGKCVSHFCRWSTDSIQSCIASSLATEWILIFYSKDFVHYIKLTLGPFQNLLCKSLLHHYYLFYPFLVKNPLCWVHSCACMWENWVPMLKFSDLENKVMVKIVTKKQISKLDWLSCIVMVLLVLIVDQLIWKTNPFLH